MSAVILLLVPHKRIPCHTAVFLDMWRMGVRGITSAWHTESSGSDTSVSMLTQQPHLHLFDALPLGQRIISSHFWARSHGHTDEWTTALRPKDAPWEARTPDLEVNSLTL